MLFASTLVLGLQAGCGGGESSLGGRISIRGVDPSQWSTLEIRAVPEKWDLDDPPVDLETLPGSSVPSSEVAWPHAYGFSDPDLPSRGFVWAWLSDEEGTLWPAEGEPVGFGRFELCFCTTHVPAYAEDVDVVIEGPG